ncbi:hypothetical protein TNCV_1883221 [Trichonephila clavipes]|nr:hypothetical protein TNCV_1883221 [Trichonephila clavipes]
MRDNTPNHDEAALSSRRTFHRCSRVRPVTTTYHTRTRRLSLNEQKRDFRLRTGPCAIAESSVLQCQR